MMDFKPLARLNQLGGWKVYPVIIIIQSFIFTGYLSTLFQGVVSQSLAKTLLAARKVQSIQTSLRPYTTSSYSS